MSARIGKAIRHLQAAIALLRDVRPKNRNAEWFRPTGHLSERGINHLRSLFENGMSTYAAAKEMGISHRAAAIRRKQWHLEQEIIL